jgi:HK97 family phage portal protein
MNFLQRWILGKELAQKIEKAYYQPGVRYEVRDGIIVTPRDDKRAYITDAYSINDIVYSIVNMVMDKVRLPEWGLYKVVNESSLKQYKSLMRNKNLSQKQYKRAMDLKYQSLEPITNYNLQLGKLKSLLEYPNADESFQDQVANGAGFKMITGDMFLWGDVLPSGANKGMPNSIELLPSQFTVIKASGDFPAKAVGYELLTWNQRFTKEQVLHEKYWNPNWGVMGEQLYGMSALKAALKNVTRNNSAKTASTSKFQNGGLEEIIYFDNPVFGPGEGLQHVQKLKIQLAEEYSGPEAQGKRAVSGHKVGVTPLGLSPVDLGIIDSEKWDAVMFCNIWGVPPELLGLVAKTYNNVKEAEKALTTRSAIPLLESRAKALTRKFTTDWGLKGQNVFIDYDTECFGELQTDMAEAVSATSQIMMITPNEERELAGLTTRPEPEADEVWVKTGTGRVPLADYQQTLMQEYDGQGDQEDSDAKVPKNGAGKAGLPIGNGANVSFKKKV